MTKLLTNSGTLHTGEVLLEILGQFLSRDLPSDVADDHGVGPAVGSLGSTRRRGVKVRALERSFNDGFNSLLRCFYVFQLEENVPATVSL